LTTRRSFLAFLIELTTGTLTVLVDVSLAKLKQVKTRLAKTRLVKGLERRGFIESKVAFKDSKVRQVLSKTVQSFFDFVL
jgi:hypothetical protein